jgi:hypothetical protein
MSETIRSQAIHGRSKYRQMAHIQPSLTSNTKKRRPQPGEAVGAQRG